MDPGAAPVGGYYYQYVDAATGYRTAWYTPTEPPVAAGAYPAAYGGAAGYGTPGVPPAYPAGPYAAQPAYGPAQPGTNGLAIASLVLGIVWVYWVGSVLALVFGYVALSQIKRTGQGGRGMAIAGIVLGWIGCAVLVIAIVAAIVAATNAPSYTY